MAGAGRPALRRIARQRRQRVRVRGRRRRRRPRGAAPSMAGRRAGRPWRWPWATSSTTATPARAARLLARLRRVHSGRRPTAASRSQRAEQAELLLAQTQRSHEEQLRAARLEESTRIAREIHDVLAHALAGLTIQLEATSALIEQGADRTDVLARVQRAHELASEGLRETRLAVGALRGDAVAAPAAVEALVAEYRAEGGRSGRADHRRRPRPARRPDRPGGASRRPGGPHQRAQARAGRGRVGRRVHAGDARRRRVVAGRRRTAPPCPAWHAGRRSRAPLAQTGGGYGVEGMRERARGARRHADGGRRRRWLARGAPRPVPLAPARTGGGVSGPVRVMVVDDQALVREGLMTLLGAAPGIAPVAAAADGEEAVGLAARHRPDVVLMDLRMPLARRRRGHAADPRGPAGDRDRRAHHPRRRGLDPRRAARRRARLPDQGRRHRRDLTRRPRRRRPPGAARPGGAERACIQAASAAARPQPPPAPASLPDELTPREAEVLSLIATRSVQRRDRRRRSSSPRRRSRPTSTMSSPRSAPATAPRRSTTPTPTGSPDDRSRSL